MNILDRIRHRDVAVDAAIAGFVLLLGLTGSVAVDAEDVLTRPVDALGYIFIGLMSLPLIFRRRYTVPVLLIVSAAWVLDRGFDYPVSGAMAGLVFAFHAAGSELSRERSTRIGGMGVVLITGWTVAGALTSDSVTFGTVLLMLLTTGAALHLGREVHQRRRQIEELEDRAVRAEREREEQARKAVADERARIARELHDVVAHQMTVMTIQADGASRIAGAADPRVSGALETIKSTGQAALADMRRVVGLLRTADADPELAPLPSLSDLDGLIGRVRDAGIGVTLDVTGERRPLSEGVELSAFRVIQESLTNAARHGGPGVKAVIGISYGDDHLDLSVVDDGRGASAPIDGSGHGLLGMKERVAVLGGELEAGPRSGGGFAVRARIPMQA